MKSFLPQIRTALAIALTQQAAAAATINSTETSLRESFAAPEYSSLSAPQATHFSVVERGASHRIWESETYEITPKGSIIPRRHRIIELGTGMHFRQGDSWVETNEKIELLPPGELFAAAATNGPCKVYFPYDIYNGFIETTGPDGATRLRSHPAGISYSDGTNSVLIAILTNSPGQLLASGNQIIWTNCFTGFAADIIATYRKSGLECDLVFRQRPPDPLLFGLSSNCRIQLFTEFFDAADPISTPSITQATENLTDSALNFGSVKLGRGKAFSIGKQARALPGSGSGTQKPAKAMAPVFKSWIKGQDGRRFLLEELPLQRIASQLDELASVPNSSRFHYGEKGTLFPSNPQLAMKLPKASSSRRAALADPSRKVEVAGNDVSARPGFVLDYVEIGDSDSFESYTFQADTTYYISSTFYVGGDGSGPVTFEGGTVIKFPESGSTDSIRCGDVTCNTRPYAMAVLTSENDDTIGEHLGWSTGSPGLVYGTYLVCNAGKIKHMRFCYCNEEWTINFSASATPEVAHSQFYRCQIPILIDGEEAWLRNVLFADCGAVVNTGAHTLTLRGEHVTANNCYPGSYDYLTNSLITGPGTPSSSKSTVVALTSSAGVYQTVGGASYYLADNSTYRNAGTPNISAGLRTDFQGMTTYPPIYLQTNLLSADTTLAPQAQRDTDIPDLGYHYPVLDFAMKQVRITNSVLTVLPGTAIATVGQYGLSPQAGSRVVCQGTPDNMVHIARYNLVQENSNTNWSRFGQGESLIGDFKGGTPMPEYHLRFADFTMPAKDGNHLKSWWNITSNSVTDCQFHGGQFINFLPSLKITNCLWERVAAIIDDSDFGVDVSPAVRDCLFYGGKLSIWHWDDDTWLFRDNLFDHTTMDLDVEGSALNDDWNGYVAGSTKLSTNGVHDLVTNLVYVVGPLGPWYQTNTSAFINRGSTNASLLSLYHYTVTTNLISGFQIKETNSIVDIGFHYVATDANGKPIDSDADGWPDYLEDLNGNGTADSGETNWRDPSDLGLKVLITRPKSNSPIP